MDNGNKNRPKVLTTNDIRKRAQDWTLAGDVGLLAHLEQFSENIINKTQETQKNFSELVDDFEELYTKVGNITNQFLALQNCQFVENRVYDEETPIEEKLEVKVQDEGEQEKLLLMQYKEAVEVGVKLLDTHFQEVQLPPNSDSDEEDEISTENSIIWKPKNPYVGKRFPLLIGSAEWWADDCVGLGTNEDILDLDKIISESESDIESLRSIEKTMKSSSSSSSENVKSVPTKPTFLESSSEDLFGFEKNENLKTDSTKGSVSLLEEPTSFITDLEKDLENETKKSDSSSENRPVFEKSSQEENPTAKPVKVDNAFTRELMAKLISVTNKSENVVKEKEKPQEELPSSKTDESLFDETDDTSDLFSTNINKVLKKPTRNEGLLFDADVDNNMLKDENDLFSEDDLFKSSVEKKPESKTFEKTAPEAQKKEPVGSKKNLVNALFDDLDDDDTLFETKPVNLKGTDKNFPSAEKEKLDNSKPVVMAGLGWKDDEGLFENIKTDFDDDFFSSSGLFDTKVSKPVECDVKTESKNKNNTPELFPEEPEAFTKREKSILDSDFSKDPFENPFGFSSSSKESTDKKPNILNSDEEDLFSKSFREESKPPSKEMLPPEDDDTALFEDKPKPPDSVSMSSSRSSLFDDVSASKSRLASVFEKDKIKDGDLFSEKDDSFFSGDAKPAKVSKAREKSSLFDECDDDDDLFSDSVGKSVEVHAKGAIDDLEDDLFKASEIKREASKPKQFDNSDGDLFFDTGKPKPPSSLSLKTKDIKPVGKLNIPDSLKIRFESVAKHITPGVKPPKEEEKPEEKDEVLDVPPQPSALLKCPSKDRVKIPGRRRPQSRRARQEAIRNSGTWDQPTNLSTKESLPSPIASNPLSPSTDEEDFFKVPELDTNFEKEDQSIFQSDLFESKSSKLDETLLFDGAPVLSPLSPTKAKQATFTPETESLFDSEISKSGTLFDDDLEGDENLFETMKPSSGIFQGGEKIKKPLFDLDDSEDDLFSGATFVSRTKPSHVKKPKEGGDAKEKGNSSFVDPLGLMSED